ncbi:MAG: GIY-YIG nuclease family protein [Patescibacteria group bacterium]|nr:GIY-YIG nuclease family protein [Patescibacteria group bacterium]
MYNVYILKSSKNGDVYIGSTNNLGKRILLHNVGKAKSTQFYRPWQLLTNETFTTRSEATCREKFLKGG